MRQTSPSGTAPIAAARVVALALLLAIVAPAMAIQDTTTIEIRTNALLAVHWWVRAEAERPPALQSPATSAAVTALRDVEQAGGETAMLWARVETFVLSGLSFEDAIRRALARQGHSESAPAYARALTELAPRLSNASDADVLATMTSLREYLPPRLPDCYRDACDALGMTDPGLTVPVYLVPQGPRPGAITYRTKDGPVCIVALDAGADCQGAGLDLLIEIIFHETLHALDVATRDQPTALNQLRAALRDSEHAAQLRDVPHTLIFLQAATVVRDHFGPDHRGYGDLCRYYRKVPEAIRALREPWAARMDEHVPLPETVAEVIVNLTKAARVQNEEAAASQPASAPQEASE